MRYREMPLRDGIVLEDGAKVGGETGECHVYSGWVRVEEF